MSVVIIGGNDRMERLYIDTCRCYGCKAKVFTQMTTGLQKQIGSPDLLILFTNTVSHKMINCAMCEAKRGSFKIERAHSSSLSSLKSILQANCAVTA